ncbi:MAG: molybdate transport system ATP-binding protein [Thermoleophilaceae bacterium]|nr:molybdate transport system ATP-binding protein [Thermoleophilaceae bacterium]
MHVLRAELSAAVGAVALDVSLTVQPGETLALAGPSGAGKTSVLRAIAGLLGPARGRVSCGDVTWLDTAARIDVPPERRGCGYLFQEYALFPHLSAWRNVGYGLPREGRRERALELLERFGLRDRADAPPHELSGGERQRVALARALARQPSALLLDEPLSALDTRTRGRASRELAGLLRDAAVPALLVTHDFGEAALLGDRVAVIDAGRIVQEGLARELTAAPASAFVADLTGAVVLTGVASAGTDGLTMVRVDGGGEVASTDPGSGRVAVSVHPWEIALAAADDSRGGSAQNRLLGTVSSVTHVGNRVRVGVEAGQPLVAEVTEPAVRELGLQPGARVAASWKAAATRLVPL